MNKRGDKILSIYWFAILILVSGGIFAMVYLFYGAPYDVRDIESRILINQIADCISYGGKINPSIISNGEFNQNNLDFLEKCNLVFSSNEWTEEQYYVEVDFYKLEDLTHPISNIKKGNNKWLADCALQQGKEYERLTRCVKKGFYSLDNLNNQYIIKIRTVIRKSEKNVKL